MSLEPVKLTVLSNTSELRIESRALQTYGYRTIYPVSIDPPAFFISLSTIELKISLYFIYFVSVYAIESVSKSGDSL